MIPPRPFRPTRQQILAARDKRVRDIIAPDLKVLFIGINPGLYTAAIGHHFGRPGNRFWPVLYHAGFTDRLLSPIEEAELLERGYGITNLVARATATADELTAEELVAGAAILRRKLVRWRPRIAAFVGITAYRVAFCRRKAKVGEQDERIEDSRVWVLPNPSGLNAHHQIEGLTKLFGELREAAEAVVRSGGRR